MLRRLCTSCWEYYSPREEHECLLPNGAVECVVETSSDYSSEGTPKITSAPPLARPSPTLSSVSTVANGTKRERSAKGWVLKKHRRG